MGKKGMSVWVSWVILVSLAIMIGMLVLQWSRGHASSIVDDVTEKGEALTFCEETGVSIDGYCQYTQTLNINVTNNNMRKIEALLVNAFDIYGNPQSGRKNTTLAPEKSYELIVVKQGVLKRAEVMPIIYLGNKVVVCQSRKVALEDIAFCG